MCRVDIGALDVDDGAADAAHAHSSLHPDVALLPPARPPGVLAIRHRLEALNYAVRMRGSTFTSQ